MSLIEKHLIIRVLLICAVRISRALTCECGNGSQNGVDELRENINCVCPEESGNLHQAPVIADATRGCQDGHCRDKKFLTNAIPSWSKWSVWTGCDSHCQSVRIRVCQVNLHPVDISSCPPDLTIEHQTCPPPCGETVELTQWEPWSTCDQNCTSSRSRQCTVNNHTGPNDLCPSVNKMETKPCDYPCSTTPSWSKWSVWLSCDAHCQSARVRSCQVGLHTVDVSRCPPDITIEHKNCTPPCGQPGQWSHWLPWSACTHSCGTGTQTRDRKCDSPPPDPYGEPCLGPTTEQEACPNVTCPPDPSWLPWESWSDCSRTCGTGIQSRNRMCDGQDLQECRGNHLDARTCMERQCSVVPSWMPWGVWSACSETCGAGTQHRDRKCQSPDPDLHSCTGDNTQIQQCQEKLCPVDGGWADWTEWGLCSVTCGSGQWMRIRTCTHPRPSHGGQFCTGEFEDMSNCNLGACQDSFTPRPTTISPSTSTSDSFTPRPTTISPSTSTSDSFTPRPTTISPSTSSSP